MALPMHVVEKYKAKIGLATFMGHRISAMTRDELLAVIGHMGDRDQVAEMEQRQRELRLIAGL